MAKIRRPFALDLDVSDVRPGDGIEVSGSISPWPYPKFKGLEVALGYRASTNTSGEGGSQRIVERTTITESDVDAAGGFRTRFTVPAEGPPSDLGGRVSDWQVAIQPGRGIRGGIVLPRAGLRVDGLSVDDLLSQRQRLVFPVEEVRTGHEAFLPTVADFAPVGASDFPGQDVSIRLEQESVARGERVRGELVVRLDPAAYLRRLDVPDGKRDKAIESLARVTAVETVPLESREVLLVSDAFKKHTPSALFLACERSPAGWFYVHDPEVFEHPLLRSDDVFVWDCIRSVELGLPPTLEIGTEYRLPFQIEVPTELGYGEPHTKNPDPEENRRTLPTNYGRPTADGREGDEYYRWLLVVGLAVRADGLPDGYSGTSGSKDSPLRAMTEVIVT